MIETTRFARRTFYVDAVQVLQKDMGTIANYCEGSIQTDEDGKQYIALRTYRPQNPRQERAYETDWIVKSPKGFKVYMDKPFNENFETTGATTMRFDDEKFAEGVKANDLPASRNAGPIPRDPRTIQTAVVGTPEAAAIIDQAPNASVLEDGDVNIMSTDDASVGKPIESAETVQEVPTNDPDPQTVAPDPLLDADKTELVPEDPSVTDEAPEPTPDNSNPE